MKKKILALILAASTVLPMASTAFAATGDVVGVALHTDIVAYINNYAVPSYAVNGQSCIVAEDLQNFGFDVIWDASTSSLSIFRNAKTTVNEMVVNKFEKSGSYFTDILETNIKVFVNGKQITSYAMNGYTMIPVEELTMFGEVYWVPEESALKLWVSGLHIRDTKQMPEKTKIGAPAGDALCVDGIGFYTNSADGVSVYWRGKNNTGKTINYYTTYYSIYNPVWDPAYCEIKDTNQSSIKVVGPVAPGEYLLNFDDVIAYTPLCQYLSLDRIYLQYSDGSSEWIDYGYIGGETFWDKYNNPEIGKSIYGKS